jgi:hypothetical protein
MYYQNISRICKMTRFVTVTKLIQFQSLDGIWDVAANEENNLRPKRKTNPFIPYRIKCLTVGVSDSAPVRSIVSAKILTAILNSPISLSESS